MLSADSENAANARYVLVVTFLLEVIRPIDAHAVVPIFDDNIGGTEAACYLSVSSQDSGSLTPIEIKEHISALRRFENDSG